MTNQQKHDLKKDGKELMRWLVLILGVLWITWQALFARPVQATQTVPTITAFTYTTPSGQKMETVSWWTDNHIKCTMTRPNVGYRDGPVALSCVSVS